MPSRASAKGVLEIDIRRWQSQFLKAENSITRLERTGRRVAGLTLFGSAFGIAAATRLLADFQEEMARVGALTGATESEFALLESQARELGATTKFSATEAADGLGFLAQAGFDTNQILASSKDFLELAAAGGLELAEAMDIASNIMQGFQLAADDSGRAADVLANTASSSNTNILQLGEGMKSVAPVAANLNKSFEETSAAMGVLGNAGIQGEKSGTALRNILLRLVHPTSEVTSGLDKLNIALADVNPATRSITDIFATFESAMARVEDQTITAAAAQEVFGLRAVASGLVLSNSVDSLRDLTQANKQAEGTTAELAKRMQDNLGGSLKRLKSQLQEVVLEIGEGGLGDSIEDTVKQATDALSEFVGSGDAAKFGEALGDQINLALNAADKLGDGLGNLIGVVRENSDEIESFGKSILIAYAALKGFQLSRFIANIATVSLNFASSSAAIAVNTAKLTRNTAAASANAAAQNAAASGAAKNAAAQSAAAGSKSGAAAGAAFTGGLSKSLSRLGVVFAGAIAGIEIGKILDDKFNISGIGADLASEFNGVNAELEDLASNSAVALSQALRDADSYNEKQRARRDLAEEQVRLEERLAELASDDSQGARETESLLKRQLSLVEKTLSAKELSASAQRDLAFEEAQATINAERRERLAKNTQEILQQTTQRVRDLEASGLISEADQVRAKAIDRLVRNMQLSAGETEIDLSQAEEQAERILDLFDKTSRIEGRPLVSAEEEARAERILALTQKIAESQGLGADSTEAKAQAQALVSLEEKRTKSAVKNTETAKERVRLEIELLKAQAGESGKSEEQIKQAQRIAKLAKEGVEAQGLAAETALSQAKERVRLEQRSTQVAEARAKAEQNAADLAEASAQAQAERLEDIARTLADLDNIASRIGSSSGGGGASASGRRSSLNTQRRQDLKEIDRLKDTARAAAREINAMGNRADSSEDDIDKMRKALRRAVDSINDAERDAKRAGTRNGTPVRGITPSDDGRSVGNGKLVGGAEALEAARELRKAALEGRENEKRFAESLKKSEENLAAEKANISEETGVVREASSEGTTAAIESFNAATSGLEAAANAINAAATALATSGTSSRIADHVEEIRDELVNP